MSQNDYVKMQVLMSQFIKEIKWHGLSDEAKNFLTERLSEVQVSIIKQMETELKKGEQK